MQEDAMKSPGAANSMDAVEGSDAGIASHRVRMRRLEAHDLTVT